MFAKGSLDQTTRYSLNAMLRPKIHFCFWLLGGTFPQSLILQLTNFVGQLQLGVLYPMLHLLGQICTIYGEICSIYSNI